VVRDGPRIIASTVALPGSSAPPATGNVTLHGEEYRAVSQTFTGFGHAPVTVTVLSALSATATSIGSSRAVAVVLIAAFLALAFGFSLLASRALQGRLRSFLDGTTARERRLLIADQGRRHRRVRGTRRGVQQHVE
jgi:hypothetical protein